MDRNSPPKTFVPTLLHQLLKTRSPIHIEDFRSSAAPPTVKDRISNSHRRLSLQRCSNCQGQVLQFTPKTFVPALLHQLSRTGSPIHTEDFRSSAAPPTVKDRFSNSHRRLSLQRCSTNCQGQVLQFTPKTFVPALLHQLSRTGSTIHSKDFRSSAAPPTVKDFLQFTPKTLAPAVLHQLSRTVSPIHTEDFGSSAAPPSVKDKFSNSHRRLSFQRCSTNCPGQDLQFTPKTFVPALLHQLSRTGFPIDTEDFRPSAAPPTVKDTFSTSHRRLSLSTNCAAPPTVKDKFYNSHRRLSLQRTPPTIKRQVLQFKLKTFLRMLLHKL